MAINKTINKSTKTHGAMRNCIEYVLKEQKITDGLVYVSGPYAADVIDYDHVYQAFLEEKKLWNKDSGRMYNHNIISFHKDENITPEEALEFGKEFVEKWFPSHQTLISVHQDRDHTHIHLVTNTVSYEDGMKLHNSRADLEKMKLLTNEMCRERNLHIAEKGKHFDGSEIEQGEIIAWSKDKYHLLQQDNKKSYVADCAIAFMEVMDDCASKQEFVDGMRARGWTVHWSDTRKHITFENEEGEKVRDSNLSKSFSMNVGKEELNAEFKRQNEIRVSRDERDIGRDEDLERYYAEVEAAISGIGTDSEAVHSDTDVKERTGREEQDDFGLDRADTKQFIRELNAKERASEEKRDDSISERADREAERIRQSLEAERMAREEEQRIRAEREERKKRSRSHGISR